MPAADKLSDVPVHTGAFELICGATGMVLTKTLAVAALLVQPLEVAVTEYKPMFQFATLVIDILGEAEVKPSGPVHL